MSNQPGEHMHEKIEHEPFDITLKSGHRSVTFQVGVQEIIWNNGKRSFDVYDEPENALLNVDESFDTYPTDEQIRDLFKMIRNTSERMQYPWPVEVYVQGGTDGLVVTRNRESYTTAFVEVMPGGTFIRGEGATIADAEKIAWEKYQAWGGCDHEWEARAYRNGGGICKHCKQFGSNVIDLASIGSLCVICNVPTYYTVVDGDIYCREHNPKRAEDEARRASTRESMAAFDADPALFDNLVGTIMDRMMKEQPDD